MMTRGTTSLRRRRAARLAALALALVLGGCRGGVLHRRGAVDLSTPPPAGAPAATFHLPPIAARTLPNGLTVLVAEYHELPIVVFHLLVQGGAAFDPAGKEGVAELTADLIRQGTAHRTAEELAREIEFLGGSIGGDAGYDFSTVSGEFLRKDLDRAFELFTDVALHPAFRPDEFRRVQGLTLAGIVAARENPSSIADRCFQAFLYGRHPYGHPTEGTEASVHRLTTADARTFYDRHYGPQGSVLVVIGDGRTDDLMARAEQAFGGWRSAASPPAALPVAARVQGRKVLLVDKPDATQAHIRVGNIAIARTDPSYVPAVVTGTILGGGFGSRLIDELRVKRSLTYGAWSYFITHRVPGDFRAATFTKVATAGEALTLTLDLLEAVRGLGRDGRGAVARPASPRRAIPAAARDAERAGRQARRAYRLRPAAHRSGGESTAHRRGLARRRADHCRPLRRPGERRRRRRRSGGDDRAADRRARSGRAHDTGGLWAGGRSARSTMRGEAGRRHQGMEIRRLSG